MSRRKKLVEIIDASWLDNHLSDPGVRVVDPRSTVNYLEGHVPSAVNLPVSKTLDKNSLELLPEGRLSEIFGEAGIDADSTVVFYDSYDGQNAAMLVWILEYLGHQKVKILSSRMEAWASDGREVLYRPVKPQARRFQARPNQTVRATLQELVGRTGDKLLDLRSREEFQGKVATEVRTGRLPGAINLPWTSLIGQVNEFLRPRRELEEIISGVGIHPNDRIVTYCTYGPRAAVGYIALQLLGYDNVRVFDGSFHQWAQRRELPVEGEGLQLQL